MKPLSEIRGRELRWEREGAFSREHHLSLGEDRFASVEFSGWTGREAIAESAEGRWTIRREGWPRRNVTVRDMRTERDIARFTGRSFGGGVLEFEDGATFEWRALNRWRGEWAFVGADGEPVVRFRRLVSWFSHPASVTLAAGSASERQSTAMVLIGRCVMLWMRHGSAAH